MGGYQPGQKRRIMTQEFGLDPRRPNFSQARGDDV